MRGIVRTTRRTGGRTCEHVCLHFYTEVFSGRARCVTSAHGVVCVRCVCEHACVCVCVCECECECECECVGRRLKNGREKDRKWQERIEGGVNIYYDDPDGFHVCVCVCVFQRWSALPAVVQKMRGQHRDEDVLPVHRKEQSSRTVDTCG